MAQNLGIIIVEKNGSLKSLTIKDYKEEELYKKCSFKKPDDFKRQTEWKVKLDGKKYFVAAYGKSEGKANTENKYDFPPPIDTTLFFGNCALVCFESKDDGKKNAVSLKLEQWEKMYEKLFGGFEDLAVTAVDDDVEEDELDSIPADKKTKHGYLKDGFVVDSESDEHDLETDDDDEDEDDETDEIDLDEEDEAIIEDIGSELSEEEYETDDD